MGDETSVTLDHSGKGLKAVDKASEVEAQTVVNLILDENALQRLDCVDTYSRLEKLSACKNNLVRMYPVAHLTLLRELCLSHNAILAIEGLKELVYLRRLELSYNNIKSIEQLNNNASLEYLDLSHNQIAHISDISYLKSLKHLHLDRNRLSNLKQCERYLPAGLETLGLSGNILCDLNTLGHLVHLTQLQAISVHGNPCLSDDVKFDYRPFVINWVMNVKFVDGHEVNAIESLKAEWLYSQGRGRQFREGEEAQLAQYLAATCPLPDAAPETEEQRKLRLILCKAQQHQQQLRELGPSPPRSKHSPRMNARIAGRIVSKSPDRMSSSYHAGLTSMKPLVPAHLHTNLMSASFSGELSTPSPTNILPRAFSNTRDINPAMTRSFDTTAALNYNSVHVESKENKVLTDVNLDKTYDVKENKKSIIEEIEPKGKENCKTNNDPYMDSNKAYNQPLEAASKMMPVPDSLMSPDYQGPLFTPTQPVAVITANQAGTRRPASTLPQSQLAGNTVSHVSHPEVTGKVVKSTRTAAGVQMGKQAMANARNSKGSPQMSRSAMSSPKLRHNAEQRKGSFSSRVQHQNHEEVNSHSAKNLYNQAVQNSGNNTKAADVRSKKQNGGNKIITALSSQTEIQVTPPDTQGANSSDEDSEMCVEKLQSIRNAANQRRQKQSLSDSGSSEGINHKSPKVKSAHCAAVTIQKLWRGYRTRNLNLKTGSIINTIQTMRARQYIEKLTCDMETTKAALDSERKIQQLQMQAINALWKKVSAMEGKDDKNDSGPKSLPFENGDKNSDLACSKELAVRELTQTCSMLQAQVQQLQGSMRDILRLVGRQHSAVDPWAAGDGIATQTEISAVHTPQGESSGQWPYQKAVLRPSSLSLTVQNNNFKPSHSNGAERKESVQTDTADNGSTQTLPGQVEKTTGTETKNTDILKIEEHQTNDSGTFENDLKMECLGVAVSENKSDS